MKIFKRTDEQEEIEEFFKARASSAWTMKHKVRTVYSIHAECCFSIVNIIITEYQLYHQLRAGKNLGFLEKVCRFFLGS